LAFGFHLSFRVRLNLSQHSNSQKAPGGKLFFSRTLFFSYLSLLLLVMGFFDFSLVWFLGNALYRMREVVWARGDAGMQRGVMVGLGFDSCFLCLVIESFVRDVLAYYHPWHHHHHCYRIVHRYAEKVKKPNNRLKGTIGGSVESYSEYDYRQGCIIRY